MLRFDCNELTGNQDTYFHSYETRNQDCVHMTACRLTLWKYSISFFGPTLWNCLPLNIGNSQTIYSFKWHYKLFLIGNAISVIVCNCMSFFVISFVVYFPETR